MSSNNLALPWRVGGKSAGTQYDVQSETEHIARFSHTPGGDTTAAERAQFAVKAVNAHDALVGACQKALASVETMMPWEGDTDGWKQTYYVLKSAIEKAGVKNA